MAFLQRSYSQTLSPVARSLVSRRLAHPATGIARPNLNGGQFARMFSSSPGADNTITTTPRANQTGSDDSVSPDLSSVEDALSAAQDSVMAASDPVTSALGYYPADIVIRTVTAMHEVSGLDWWLSIVGVTIALRTAMLPITIDSIKNTHRIQLARPELERLSEYYRENPAQTVEEQMEMRNKMKAAQDKHGAKMYKMFVPLLIQMPLFVSFFFGLRRMSEDFPSFQQGGALWFTDLTVPDPSYALPVIAGATFLTTIELGGETGETEQTKKMKNMFRFMAVAMVPLTMNQPQGVFVYWVTSNVYTLAQTLILKAPPVRQALGMPLNPAAALAAANAAPAENIPAQSNTLSSSPPKSAQEVDVNTRSTKRSRRKKFAGSKH